MTIHVLGLGESLKNYTPDGNITIGVNDIHSKVKTDYVVCVDEPRAFSVDRLQAIRETKCKGFYSQVDFWKCVANFNKIEFNPGRGIVTNLDSEKFCYSISSPYVATVLAYKMGATKIVLHGVDFQTHPNFLEHKKEKALNDFRLLNDALKQRDVTLFVGSEYSALSEFVDIYNSTSAKVGN